METEERTEVSTSRKMTFAENLILMIKVFAAAGAVIGALWGLDHWVNAK
jgi:hypothetical protein